MWALGFDTSNYTTSVAMTDGALWDNRSRLLDVPEGALGLRQADALFSHVRRLPELAQALFEGCGEEIGVIGASMAKNSDLMMPHQINHSTNMYCKPYSKSTADMMPRTSKYRRHL